MDDRRHELENERRQTLHRLATLTGEFDEVVAASRDSNADDEHDPEGATIAFERSQLSALVQQARDHMTEIDEAIARLASRTYGVCQGCGQPIGTDRLTARPVARTCIACATAG